MARSRTCSAAPRSSCRNIASSCSPTLTPFYLPEGQIANGQVIVAEVAGEVAGFAAVVGGELDGLFVEPELWGQGIGRLLADAATHEARRKGLSLTVIAAPRARRFYESCGFAVEGEERTRFGPALRMSR